ncbi:uncharacterized protein A4U43_C05F15590 [Asparagus officinalis]|uniref:SBP-type domain-containing protein n=1 Tax=Asparagus officinalis TaxID=4686 RepID=A0A5P1ESW1_ASPOF|nr:uncharacterized protein A4U43_C05F15590 [Asparagus officinalis]
MEGDVGAQVAPPIFLHQPHPIRFHDGPIHAKKRDFPWQNPNNSSYQQQQINQWIPNPNTNWNPRLWDWDSSKFTAKPSQNAPNLPNLGSNDSQSKPRAEEAVKAQNLPKNLEEDGETLTLNLGGGVYSAAQEQAVRPSKRVRSGSPGSRGNYPMCQVDDCRADLSGAKDYHRRHKVCEIHISDHSPSSSNSDAQDRTGRIIFKLFDKDPSKIPAALRSQIVNWLAHSPSEMESYIRPGCVVLSIYASMPSFAWDELEGDLLHRINSLVQNSDSEFWIDGRFLVRTSRQLASHKDGKVRLCKSWRTWSAPEITSVSPVAVVSGQETSLVLKGRNLTIPGTKIHCTFMGGYTSKEVLGSAYPGTIYDDASVESFTLPGGIPNSFGRCFIEVENAFRGNSFPVIIANSNICQELRALESEFENEVGTRDVTSEEQTQDNGRPRSREDLLHFLNELGWLFQRKNSIDPRFMDFSTTRFKFLLTFSIERDWSSLIRTLLDILAERSLNNDTLAQESLEMLLEIQLLNRAVKRKCRKMVDLLLSYYVIMGEPECSGSKIYLFPPNSVGPGGITPLHLAASTQDSEDMVDALTNDPQEIGMNCWNSILDESGQTPYMYASQRNNHFYNRLVARKLADRKNCQVSINVEDEISMDKSWIVGEGEKVDTVRTLEVTSCSKCAFMEKARGKRIGHTRGLLERPYVHSMLAIAAVCVCVCLFFRGSPQIGSVAPFKWENLDFGPR